QAGSKPTISPRRGGEPRFLVTVESHPIDGNGIGYILDLLLAHRLKAEGEFLGHLVRNLAGDIDVTGFGQLLKSGGDIHPLAVAILPLDNDLAEINADTNLDALGFRYRKIALGEAALKRNRTFDRIDDAPKLGEQAIAHQFEDAPVVALYLRLEQLL